MAVFCDEQELITSILLSCHKINAQFASLGLSKNGEVLGGNLVDFPGAFE